MKLILAEKPELGRAIAQALKLPGPERNGVISGLGCTVVWAYGHLLQLVDPAKADARYAQWRLSDLPIFFEPWTQEPIPGKEERLQQIGRLIGQADSIIHAGDPDDEGQYLIDEILTYFHNTKPVQRVLINDNTPSEIQKAFQHLQPNERFVPIGKAAAARAISDYTFGVNYSRFFGLTLHIKGLSVGRVQTPTLGLVVNRDRQIENHVQRTYYELTGTAQLNGVPVEFLLKPDKAVLDEDGHVTDRSFLETFPDAISDPATARVVSQRKQEAPPLPFNLVKLQAHMNEKYGIPVSRTLALTQELRDKYKAITYNRSDCQYLNEEQYREASALLPGVMQRLGISLPLEYSLHAKCFCDANVTAHHAIIPTAAQFDLSALSDDLQNVYREIAVRYLIQFLPPRTIEETKAVIEIPGKGSFAANSMRILDAGFAAHYPAKALKETPLSGMLAGSYRTRLENFQILEKHTSPPKRYTQATLITDMTHVAKYVQDPKAKEALQAKDKDKKGENGSIGTPATRDTILTTLVKRGYVRDDGKHLISTSYGRQLYDLLPDDIKKPDLTALWWTIQEDIKAGRAEIPALTHAVLESICNHLKEDYSQAHVERQPDREEIGKCPVCGQPVYESEKAFGCSGYRDGCKFALWKDNAYFRHFGKKLTKAAAKALLGPHHRVLEKGLSSKSGKPYDAYFVLSVQDGKAHFSMEFPKTKKKKT